jgi:hypothetical protein
MSSSGVNLRRGRLCFDGLRSQVRGESILTPIKSIGIENDVEFLKADFDIENVSGEVGSRQMAEGIENFNFLI